MPFVCQTQSSVFLRHFLGLSQRSPSLDYSGSCLGPLFGNIINLMMSSIKPKNGGNNKYLFLCLLEVINKLNEDTKDFKKAPGSSCHLLRLLRRPSLLLLRISVIQGGVDDMQRKVFSRRKTKAQEDEEQELKEGTFALDPMTMSLSNKILYWALTFSGKPKERTAVQRFAGKRDVRKRGQPEDQ